MDRGYNQDEEGATSSEHPKPTGPLPVPAGSEIRAATARGLTLICPEPLPAGAVLEFDVVLGARPLEVMARVLTCHPIEPPPRHQVEVEFVAMAQIDRDALADFLQAVGPALVRVRAHRD